MDLMTKQQARAAARARRAGITPAGWRAIGAAMAAELFAQPAWQDAGTVFCFAALPDEPDTLPVLRRALAEGKTLCLPRVLPEGGGAMALVRVTDFAALRPGRYGIPEPADGEVLPALGPDALALIPCLAAGRDGVRLGRGGGYYDRFLAGYTGQKRLLCPTALLFDTLPADGWDVRFAPQEFLCGDKAGAGVECLL